MITFDNIKQGAKETGTFVIATVLSCGPSQLFGSIKLASDTCLFVQGNNRKKTISSHIKRIQTEWPQFHSSAEVSKIACKLHIKPEEIVPERAEQYFLTKERILEKKLARITRSLTADFYALLPLVGAHISWRIATGYTGKSYLPMFSCAMAQLFENSKHKASWPIFIGRKGKRGSKPEGNIVNGSAIKVVTSTKSRTIRVFHEYSIARTEGIEDVKDTPLERDYRAQALKNPTVVLFHPNLETGVVIAHNAGSFYRHQGYNTLAVTIGGYQGSPGVITSEKSLCQDIEAIKKYLADLGVEEVGYHGCSLGCAAALQAAAGDSLVKFKTLFVVLDQPFSSVEAVGDNYVGILGKGVCKAGCPVGYEFELPGGLWTKTDGFDNVLKAAKLKEENIPLICFERKQDRMMGRKKKNGAYTENFARDLLIARYGKEHHEKYLISLPGKHGNHSVKHIDEKKREDSSLYTGNDRLAAILPQSTVLTLYSDTIRILTTPRASLMTASESRKFSYEKKSDSPQFEPVTPPKGELESEVINIIDQHPQ